MINFVVIVFLRGLPEINTAIIGVSNWIVSLYQSDCDGDLLAITHGAPPFLWSTRMTKISLSPLLSSAVLLAAFATPSVAFAQSNPSVVVTVENAQPSRGVFLTPPWLGIHDGTFDTYDGGALASIPLGGNEIESLAEDGNNGPITATFDARLPNAPQVQGLPGPAGPLAPGDSASITFNVDPSSDRYFSYASMIIPSNDFFIANGNPFAHQLFDDDGKFVGQNFVVSGDETNDAGTEANDEIASNVAFLAQGGPNIGTTEALPVTMPCLLYTSPSPRDRQKSRMPSSA